MLLNPKNILKSNGFSSNRVTQLGCWNLSGFEIFMSITFLDLLFYFYAI